MLARYLKIGMLVLGCCVSPGAGSASNDLEALVAKGAFDLRRLQLGSPAVTEIFYKVALEFPGRAIPPEKIARLRNLGWKECAPRRSWEHFGDYTRKPSRLVHQYGMALATVDQYLVIALQYSSALPAADPTESKPDNKVQQVYVIHYDLSAPEVRKQLGSVVSDCLTPRP